MGDKKINCEFQFKCPLSWDDLEKLENEKVRFCEVCRKDVHFARNQDEFRDLAKEGKCVAIRTFEMEEVLTVNNRVCNNCQSLMPPDTRFCLNCGYNTFASNGFPPTVTMGLPLLPPENSTLSPKPETKAKKSRWKFWK